MKYIDAEKLTKAIENKKVQVMSMIEDLLQNQIYSWIKTLPPLPPGWVYDFIPGEPEYNPETNAWETTMKAKPRQMFIKED